MDVLGECVEALMYLTERQVAELIQVKLSTLRVWRMLGKGPKFVKFNGTVRYPDKQFKEE